MVDIQSLFDKLMVSQRLEGVSAKNALRRLGLLVDLSGDLGREEGNVRALAWADELAKRKLLPRQAALLDYFRANLWANRQSKKHRDADTAWAWEQPDIQQQVFYLRRAAQHRAFPRLARLRRCQIFTNLGNQLDTLGRFVEAQAMWGRALAEDECFGMALGNRGYGRFQYAASLYDHGHRDVFLFFAHKDLSDALSRKAKYEGDGYSLAKTRFSELKANIEAKINIKRAERLIVLKGYPMGRSKAERQYRRWTLQNGLFLNPLNDLGFHTIAAQDVLSLPSITTAAGQFPPLIGFFNQMKQEYASGRWLLYEGLHARSVHFSDHNVLLINTLDYPSYGLAVEKVKAAYRIAYSIFDKIASFLNEYGSLGIRPKDVYFKTLWFDNPHKQPRTVRKEFASSRNWPLRGLYWLSKDLFDPELHFVMEPEAQELYVIRNKLEHSYLKVHEMLLSRSGNDPISDMFTDRLAYSIGRDDFQAKTIHLYRLARAALIYISLGMHREEDLRRKAHKGLGLIAPMMLHPWRDQDKR
jgi:hypothetical protein